MKHAIFVHDPDGDMGYGRIVGPYPSGEAADFAAELIRSEALKRGGEIECVVVPIGKDDPGSVVREVLS